MTDSTTFVPTCSVVICTRNRPDRLNHCLAALNQLAYPRVDILVVDNAPTDTRARDVAHRWGARYLVEPVAGLSRARNTGARACTSDVIAFTDDDAAPEREWLSGLLAPFRDERVAVVTGRTLPLLDATDAIAPDATDLGPNVIRLDRSHPLWFEMACFGGVGNGNNMAFRRRVFDEWRGFDERLGRGAPLSSCEEHRAFAELIEDGHAVVYTPDARVRHPVPKTLEEHHRDHLRLRSDLAAYAVFLFFVTRHKWRVMRYVAEAAVGTERSWRFHTESAPSAVPRWQLARAYVSEARRGLWALIRGARLTATPKPMGHESDGKAKAATITLPMS